MKQSKAPLDPEQLSLLSAHIGYSVYELMLTLRRISDLNHTFGTGASFHVESLELLRAIEQYISEGRHTSTLIVGQGIREHKQEDGSIVYTLMLGDDIYHTSISTAVTIRILYVQRAE
jgi:hypothetical protein